MSEILQVAYLGHPCLYQKAEAIKNFQNSMLQNFINSLDETCKYALGLGLAAPQVHHPFRLFIMAPKPSVLDQSVKEIPSFAVVNPEIINKSNEVDADWEACLSIPNYFGYVRRHRWVRVLYYDRHGEKHETTYIGKMARIFQHEHDHLDGLVFTDIIKPREIVHERQYRQMIDEAREKPRSASNND